MKRQVELQEISDGKLYGVNDLVKADCGDCEGCSACCRGMGESIILDPLDVSRLTKGLKTTFEELLAGPVELNMSDGLILPNLKMQEEDGCCAFLDQDGRCSIHDFRPGICRLFPLGRYYENGGFQYFLQIHECRKENRSKVKVKKWIDTPDVKKYEKFVSSWHYFLLEMEEYTAKNPDEVKKVTMDILNRFYLIPFKEDEDFYLQFEKRLTAVREKYTAR